MGYREARNGIIADGVESTHKGRKRWETHEEYL